MRTGKMSFALDYTGSSHGSFTAWGTGLIYEYDAEHCILYITHRDKMKELVIMHFDNSLSKSPLAYVTALEKAVQIKALMYSNNSTINLTEVLDFTRLKGILDSVALLSHYAYDLQRYKFERFSRAFCRECGLKNITIKKFLSRRAENEFFVARIETLHGNAVCVRAQSLASLVAALSDKTMRDLITMEFGHKFEASAHGLLGASAKLSSLSYILDEGFVPLTKVRHTELFDEENPVTEWKN